MQKYLKNNSLVREEIINYKLIYELKKAAALHNYHLKTYLTAVDIEGYDLIIDDSALLRKVQLKTKLDSKTRSWLVHKSIMLPGFNFEDYGFHSTICPATPGCIFLLQIKFQDEELFVEYYYTDINIISLMALGFLFTTKESKEKAKQILKGMKNEIVCKGKVRLNKGMFLKVKNPESLLNIAGFQVRNNKHVTYNMWQTIKNYNRPDQGIDTLKKRVIQMTGHLSTIEREFKSIISDDFRLKIKYPKDVFPFWFEKELVN
jgi:hypothetical protein